MNKWGKHKIAKMYLKALNTSNEECLYYFLTRNEAARLIRTGNPFECSFTCRIGKRLPKSTDAPEA